ncbi:MAG: PQQ-dependent sugar dehydrogenase [Planctomycetota bacterium]
MRLLTALILGLSFLQILPPEIFAQDDWLPAIPVGTKEVKLELHASGFTGNINGTEQIIPTKLATIPDGSGRMVVATLGGLLRVIDSDGNVATGNNSIYLDTNTDETSVSFFAYGLTSVAFHPDFAKSGKPGFGKLYVLVTEAPKPVQEYDFVPAFNDTNEHAAVLVEYTVEPGGIASNVLLTEGLGQNTTRRELFVAQEPDNEHNFCDLAFDQAGRLYISAGDGEFNFNFGVNLAALNAPDLTTVLGKVLRIDPLGNNSFNGNYGIVSDNVFAIDGDASTLDEIYSIGHRNPWRLSIDRETNRILVGEVGHFNIEEVNIATNGRNYGWPSLEGSFLINFDDGFDLTADSDDAFAISNGLTPPVFEYDHQDGKSVTGGFVYRGNKIPALKGRYLFGDFAGGDNLPPRLFAGNLDTGQFDELQIAMGSASLGQPVSFGEAEDGELFIVSSNGNVLSIESTALFGDVNLDGSVNLLDVQLFVERITSGVYQLEADVNQDGVVNLLDVDPFIGLLNG